MLRQLTLPLTASVIFLPGLADGALPSGLLDGQTIALSGRDPSLASLSPRLARDKGLLMSDTSGPRCFGTSSSIALASSLANRLHQNLPLIGGMSWQLIWRARATPALRQIYALRASAPSMSGKGFTGALPTPLARDYRHGLGQEALRRRQMSRKRGVSLPEYMQREIGDRPRNLLNPAFVLLLMGYPTEWAQCAARVTRSSRKSQQSSSNPIANRCEF